jgi:amino acid permease
MQYKRLLHDFFSHHHIYHPEWLPRGSDIAATFNVASSTIGVGTLAMPTAARGFGVYLFFPAIIAVVLLNVFSLYVSCRCADLTHFHSFELLSKSIFGQRWVQHGVEITLIINCIGSMIAYIVVIGDIGYSVAAALLTTNMTPSVLRFVVQLLCFSALMFPLSLLGSMNALKYASIVGVTAISVLIVAITLHGYRFGLQSNLTPLYGDSQGILGSLPLLFFAFTNQVNGIEIYSELPIETRTPWNFIKRALIAMTGVSIAYILVGYAGLAEFGSAVKGNVLKNYTVGTDVLLTCAFLGIGIKTILTFPLLMFPTREALFHLQGVENIAGISIKVWVMATTVMGFFCFGLGILIPNIIVLFGLLGAVCASLFAFILPALLALRFKKYWEGRTGTWVQLERLALYITLIAGVVCAVAGTYYSVLALIAPS